MLLAIDIGNTNISFGVFKGRKIVKKTAVPTRDYIHKIITRKLGRVEIDDIIICSVVPKATRILAKDLKKIFSRTPRVLGKDIFVPIKNLYHKPKQVGQDRLVNAYAGIKLYGAPLIIVDFGTAITLDVVSRKGEYLGGIISPGVEMSLEVLVKRAALLPKIKIQKPKVLVGRDTKNSMNSGIIYGTSCLVDGLLAKIRKKMSGKKAAVIATGGHSRLLSVYCRGINKSDPDLTLKGIKLILSSLKTKT